MGEICELRGERNISGRIGKIALSNKCNNAQAGSPCPIALHRRRVGLGWRGTPLAACGRREVLQRGLPWSWTQEV